MATTLHPTSAGISNPAPASWREYAEALAFTLIGWGGRELLTPVVGPTALPYIFFFPAVAAASWRGGAGPGVMAVALSIAIALWRFILPADAPMNTAADVVSLLAFSVAAALIVGPISALRRTRSHLKRQLEDARRVESELASGREAAARLAAIVEYSGDAIFTKDLNGVVQTWNASAERLFGYKAEDIVGKPITVLIPPDRIEEEHAILARLRSGQPVERLETVRVAKGGRHIRVSLSISPLRDESGGIVGASKIVHDITEIVEAREALDRERQLLKTTLASIGDAVIVTDTEGRVTFLNGEAERLTGWSDAEATGIDLPAVFRIVNEETRRPVENPVDKVRRLGIVVGLANHTILISKTGAENPIDDSAAPIRHDGVDFGVVLVFRDVTDRRKAEDALRLADRRKDEFLAVLSHELRNPLNPIQLAAAMLKQIGPSKPELIQLRDVIDRQARQMGRLLDDLLDVSRISSGKITLRREPMELAAAITMAIEASRAYIDTFGHELVVKIAPEPIEVDGDVGRLAQVIGNLLNNAAKFTDRGGRIEVTLERRGNQAMVRVRDNGAGIAEDQWPHIFEMFAQGDRTLERNHGGLGVGLALARTVVEMHGGTLEGSSEGADRGSEFVVTLPVTAGARPAAAPESAPPVQAATPFRILIADDNLDSASTLAAGLGHAGHDVRTVPDGVAVLDHVNVFKPQVVILDIGLPGLNGYDVARRLRKSYGQSLMLIAVTGWGQEEDKRQAREAGFDHHLTKPITLESIHQVLGTPGSAPSG
jgi:PAS domain S-box-containing protein